MVPVFAHEGPLNTEGAGGVVGAHGGDVNEEAGVGIDPAGVDYVKLVLYPRDGVVRVDLQEIRPAAVDLRDVVVVFGHVVVFC